MKYLYLLICLLLFPHLAFSQGAIDRNIYHADAPIGHCIIYLDFLKSQEKDSIWNETHISYETKHKKVSILGAKLWRESKMCGDRFYEMDKTLKDSIPIIVIHDKCAEIDQAKYAIHTKSIFCEETTRWVWGRPDPNCISASVCDCRVICLAELPAMTIQIRHEILLELKEKNPQFQKTYLTRNIDDAFVHCVDLLQNFRTGEKDSIWANDAYSFETKYKKFSVVGYKIDTFSTECPHIYWVDKRAIEGQIRLHIQEKPQNKQSSQYQTIFKTITKQPTWKWYINTRGHKNFNPAYYCELSKFRSMEDAISTVAEVAEGFVRIQEDILLKKNEDGKYVEK
ncbi:MAG: hypothetical protein ACKVTZ_02145 [Bacteroidia bacterium]